ncbi:MAG: hypothetical protein WD825_12910 [Gemmatimonadaceae bacterium]
MAISPHLIRKLQEALGHEATEDLVSHLEGGESLRADVAELRHEMQLGFAKIDARFANLDARFANVDGRFANLDEKIDLKLDGLAAILRSDMKEQTGRLLMWSFVFWIGAVGAIAALAGVLK